MSTQALTPAPRKRADPKTDQVVRSLREQIVAGELEPGFQLPTWSNLEDRYKVGRTTLTRAMDRLKREGFVFADATRGTFVAHEPPHLHRYALAFRGVPDSADWNRFWWGISNEAVALNEQGGCPLALYYGVRGGEATPAHEQLVDEVRRHRFAGVVFVGFPPEISHELLDHPWLAKVAIHDTQVDDAMPHVFPDRSAFVRRSLEYLRDAGRRRIAVVSDGHPEFAAFDRAIGEMGFDPLPCGRVSANHRDPESAGRIVRLLMSQRDHDRPDALIITNDLLVESAMAGVMACGLRVPDELCVLAHGNWPSQARTGLPLVRLGYDARQVLHAALREAENQRLRQKTRPSTPIAPLFTQEVPARWDRQNVSA